MQVFNAYVLHVGARANASVSAARGGGTGDNGDDGDDDAPVVISPSACKVIRGEGMPISKAPGTKGDLTIKFDVAFPKSLTDEKKRALRALLAGT